MAALDSKLDEPFIKKINNSLFPRISPPTASRLLKYPAFTAVNVTEDSKAVIIQCIKISAKFELVDVQNCPIHN